MTITADFSGGEKTATTEPLYQWDTGQKLALSGLPATSTDIQVHFANAAMAQAIVKATATENSLPTCDIPNEFLQFGSAAKARAWVFYRTSNTEGYTVRTVLIPVTPRKRPNDYVSPEDPDSKGIVDRAIELLEHYQSDLDSKVNLKPIPAGGYDDCTESGTIYYGSVNGFTVNVLCVRSGVNQSQYKLRADNALIECRTRHYSNGAWGSWDSWTPVGREGNIADGAVTWAKLAAALQTAINAKAPASTAYTFDSTTTNVVYNADNPKTIYLNATVDGEDGIVITAKDNGFQYFLGRRGTLKIRYFTGGTSYSDWTQVTEHVDNKKNSITSSNRTSTDYYPSIKAVVDYLAANYLSSGDNTVSWANLAATVQTLINGKESASNKLTSADGIDENSTDTKYPTAMAVFDFGVQILDDVADDLVLKENLSNKKTTITGYETSNQFYPTTKAVYDYGTTITNNIEDVKAYIGYTSGDILGLRADFENKVFTRLSAAVGLSAGSDFNAFPMYGQRRRVVVDSNGVIIDGYSPEDVGESDTDVDVMVYQPKFYYKVIPLKLEKQTDGLGYHIRKANYYISSTPHAGFKLHPLFYDGNGNEIDYVLFSAYEASYMWRRQVSTTGYVDRIFHDGVDTDTTIETSAVLKSLPGVKPISGQYKEMNKVNLENCALRKSPNWHLDTIQSVAANQLLMAIEYGTFNTQSAIGQGIVTNVFDGSNNCASLTGSTSAETFNTASGMANETIYDVAGTETPYSENGKVAVTYRGIENPWGNIWKHINGINIWGDGHMGSGQAYIADGFTYNESSHSGNYKATGFTLANASNDAYSYISAFGYGKEEYDWLFMPSETAGNSSLPVGDNYYCTPNLNEYRIARLGGHWHDTTDAGSFYWNCAAVPDARSYYVGGRLLFVPTATV